MNKTALRQVTAALLFTIPLFSALGSVVSVAGFAFIRPLAALLFVAALGAATRWNTIASWVVLLGVTWLTWGLASLHMPDHLKKLFSIAIGIGTVLAFVIYPWTRQRVTLLARAWLFAWVIAVAPALIEIPTGIHLPNYLESSPQWIRMSATDTASFFVNPNPFAFFLCASMLVFAMGARFETPRIRAVMLWCSLANPILIYFTNSRVVLAVSLLITMWVLFSLRPLRPYVRHLSALVATSAAVLTLLVAMSPDRVESILASFEGSGSDRLMLYLNALWMFLSTGGLGIGPGMFEPAMQSGVIPHLTTEAVNPHSGVFEVLSQYGFLVSALLGAGLIVLAKVGAAGFIRRSPNEADRILFQGITVSALTLPILSFGDSTFLDSPIAWVHIATMLAYAQALKIMHVAEPAWVATDHAIPERMQLLTRNN